MIADIEDVVFPIAFIIVVGGIIERGTPNACDAVGNRDIRQPTATGERRTPNACDAVGNCDACKTAATLERPISNACKFAAIPKGDACQACATFERRIPHARHAVANRDACKAAAIIERLISNACDGQSFVCRRDIHFDWRARIISNGILRAIVGTGKYKPFGKLRLGRAALRTDAVHIIVCDRRHNFLLDEYFTADGAMPTLRQARCRASGRDCFIDRLGMRSHRNALRIAVIANRACVGHLAFPIARRLLRH